MSTSHGDQAHILANIRKMMLSSSVAQLVPVLGIFLLARLYPPFEFGSFAVYQSAIGLIGVLSTCRYELAIVVAAEQKDADALYTACTAIAAGFSALAVPITWFLFRSVTEADPLRGSLYPVRWFLPLGLFINGLYQASAYLCNREADFRRIGLSAVMLQLGNFGVSAALGLLGVQSRGLVCGAIAGQLAALACVAPNLQYLRKRLFRAPPVSLVSVLRRYKRFAVYNTPNSIIGNLAIGVPAALLLQRGFAAESGYFSMARRMLYLPATLLCTSLSQVIYERSSADLGTARFTAFFHSLLTIIQELGMPFFVFFGFWASVLVPLLLGNQWRPSAPIIVGFAPCAFAFLYASWSDRIYDAAGMQLLSLKLLIVSTAISLSLFYALLVWGLAPVYVITCYAAILTAYYVFYTYTVSRIVSNTTTAFWVLMKNASRDLAVSLCVFGLLRYAPLDGTLRLVISMCVLLAVTARRLHKASRALRLEPAGAPL